MFPGNQGGQHQYYQWQNPNMHGMRQSSFFNNPFPNNVPMQHAQANRGGIQGLLQRFTNPGGMLQGAAGKSGGGLTQTLSNVQQVLKMAQSATPIIQQYGPMVKNLPTMVRLLKAFNEADDDDSGEEDTIEKEEDAIEKTENKVELTEENLHKMETDVKGASKKQPTTSTGVSVPKLYI